MVEHYLAFDVINPENNQVYTTGYARINEGNILWRSYPRTCFGHYIGKELNRKALEHKLIINSNSPIAVKLSASPKIYDSMEELLKEVPSLNKEIKVAFN